MHFLEWKWLNSDSNFTEICSQSPIDNKPALVWVMAWRLPGDKPLPEPLLAQSLKHICGTRGRWVHHKYHSCPDCTLLLSKTRLKFCFLPSSYIMITCQRCQSLIWERSITSSPKQHKMWLQPCQTYPRRTQDNFWIHTPLAHPHYNTTSYIFPIHYPMIFLIMWPFKNIWHWQKHLSILADVTINPKHRNLK